MNFPFPALCNGKRPPGRRLPVKFVPARPQVIPIRMKAHSSNSQHILVVGAEPSRLSLVSELFKLAGHRVEPVCDPKLVSGITSRTSPDLVLVDASLSESDRRIVQSGMQGPAHVSRVFVVEFSLESLRVDDSTIRVNGHVIQSRRSPG